MGRLRDLARRAKNAVRDRVRDTGMPSSPPDVSAPPPPAAAPASAPSAAPPAPDGDATEQPWYLQGDDEAWGWENTNAREDADSASGD